MPDEDDDLRERLPAFLLDTAQWLSSMTTRSMTDAQRGWFIQLLVEAWQNGEPQGTLPDDDKKLRKMADFQPVLSSTIGQLCLVHSSANSLANSLLSDGIKKAVEEQETLWFSVRSEFVPSEEHHGFLHNPKLTRILKKAKRDQSRYILMGKKGAAKRWGNREGGGKPSDSHIASYNSTNSSEIDELSSSYSNEMNLDSKEPLSRPDEEPLTLNHSRLGSDTNTLFPLIPLTRENRTVGKLATQVFEFWKLETGHSRALFGIDRRNKVEARLREGYTVDQLKDAVRGCKQREYNQGNNDTGEKYDDIELICRKSSNVERFINIYNDSKRDERKHQNAKSQETAGEKRSRLSREQDEYIRRLQSGGSEAPEASTEAGLRLSPGDVD